MEHIKLTQYITLHIPTRCFGNIAIAMYREDWRTIMWRVYEEAVHVSLRCRVRNCDCGRVMLFISPWGCVIIPIGMATRRMPSGVSNGIP